MHQGELDFDLILLVDVVTTVLQHGTPDLGEATRERHATHRLPEFKLWEKFQEKLDFLLRPLGSQD